MRTQEIGRRDFLKVATSAVLLRPFSTAFADEPIKVSWDESNRSIVTPQLECAIRAAKASGQKSVDAVITLNEYLSAREICETPLELINGRGKALFDYRIGRFKKYIGYNDKTKTGLGRYLSNIRFDSKKNQIFVTITTEGLCCATCTPSFLKAEPVNPVNIFDFNPKEPDMFMPFYRSVTLSDPKQIEALKDIVLCQKKDGLSCIVKCDGLILRNLANKGYKIDWVDLEEITSQTVKITAREADYERLKDFTFDIVQVTDNEIIGTANEGDIRELRKAGFEVTVLSQKSSQFLIFNKKERKLELSKDELEKYLSKATNPDNLKLMLGYMGAKSDELTLEELKDKLRMVAPLLVSIFNERHLTGKAVKIIEPKAGRDLIDVTEQTVSPEGYLLALIGVVLPHVSVINNIDLSSVTLCRGRELFEYGSVREGIVGNGVLLSSVDQIERKFVPLGIPIFIPSGNTTYYIDVERSIAD